VLALAALGAAALLDGLRIARAPADADGRPWTAHGVPVLFAVAARWLLPLALVVSVYVLFRGHNAPGGGFIAGLVTAVALIVQRMARDAGGRAPDAYARLAGAGLLVAGATGVGAWFFGKPFLTSAHGHPALPALGEVTLASAALFDIGVYLTVVGATMLALIALAGTAPPPEPRR
jgi:multicomponent K+:H+ antiporter subunit A